MFFMTNTKWKFLLISQVILILSIVFLICFRMGLINFNVTELAVAETNIPNIEVVKTEEIKEPIIIPVAKKEDTKKEIVKQAMVSDIQDLENDKKPIEFIKEDSAKVKAIEEKYKDKIKSTHYATVTSYNSEAGQTDDSPCIAASGMDVCKRNIEDIVATNDLPFHTKIMIPEYFGEQIFYVEDRMNARYTGTNRTDIWMKSKAHSKEWGAKKLKIIVLK